MIWIQVVLEGLSTADLKTDHSNPNSEVAQIWPHATRIAKCENQPHIESTIRPTHVKLSLQVSSTCFSSVGMERSG